MIPLESEVVNENDPLYTDEKYRERRAWLQSLNSGYIMGTPIKKLDYLDSGNYLFI